MFGELKKQYLIVAAVMLSLLFGAGVRYGRYLEGEKNPPAAVLPMESAAATSPTGETGQAAAADREKAAAEVTVYITGAVIAPGVFTLKEGSRVVDVLDLAKAADDADLSLLNLAKKLKDGEKILVPVKRKAGAAGSVSPEPAPSGQETDGTAADPAGEDTVDINQAAAADLEKLPGIGPSKAQAMIKYREEKGPFNSLSDVDKVPGIGPATLNNLKDKITF